MFFYMLPATNIECEPGDPGVSKSDCSDLILMYIIKVIVGFEALDLVLAG